jgi:hypothetical protein
MTSKVSASSLTTEMFQAFGLAGAMSFFGECWVRSAE